ncbi:MAG: hypothetical protein CMA27_06690 [Euryarchaeota archaeon]|nr:hypothetical protein [Euryarchaeota archaeon]|tara:strand:- start:106 stop:624 length:519 start_codon:yes stop_codon:yes gene_type:complete
MEKRINSKTRTYLQDFKNNIKTLVDSTSDLNDSEGKNQLLAYIFDYQPLEFTKLDFQKRKRVKNIVPYHDRCRALRANKQQCTRRKKNDSTCFCGTHIKGIPHGQVDEITEKPTHTKRVVRAQDIKGIIYYIDDHSNVYDPNDIMNNTVDPKIIAKYVVNDGDYSIPSLFKK